MYPRDWQRFLDEGEGNEIAIAQVPAHIQQFFSSPSEKVFLHHSYAKKAADKHHLSLERFPLIFDAIEFGTALSDRPHHVSFFYLWPEEDRLYQVTIKKALDTGRLYLCTFHRVQQRKLTNRLKTAKVIEK